MPNTYYLATDGSDVTGTANDVSKPFATLAKIATLIGNGDTISIKAGTYRQQFPETLATKSNITIVGASKSTTTVSMPISGYADVYFGVGATVGLNPLLTCGESFTVRDITLKIPSDVESSSGDPLWVVAAEDKDNLTFLRVDMIAEHTAVEVDGTWVRTSGGSCGLILSDKSIGHALLGTCQNVEIANCTVNAAEYGLVACGSGTISNVLMEPSPWESCFFLPLGVSSDTEENHATNSWIITNTTIRQLTTENRTPLYLGGGISVFLADAAISNTVIDLPQEKAVPEGHIAVGLNGGTSTAISVSLINCLIRCSEYGGEADVLITTGLVDLTITTNFDSMLAPASDVRDGVPRFTGAIGDDIGTVVIDSAGGICFGTGMGI